MNRWRYVQGLDDGVSEYQCLRCYETWRATDSPKWRKWRFCPLCGCEWEGEHECREHSEPKWDEAWRREEERRRDEYETRTGKMWWERPSVYERKPYWRIEKSAIRPDMWEYRDEFKFYEWRPTMEVCRIVVSRLKAHIREELEEDEEWIDWDTDWRVVRVYPGRVSAEDRVVEVLRRPGLRKAKKGRGNGNFREEEKGGGLEGG